MAVNTPVSREPLRPEDMNRTENRTIWWMTLAVIALAIIGYASYATYMRTQDYSMEFGNPGPADTNTDTATRISQ